MAVAVYFISAHEVCLILFISAKPQAFGLVSCEIKNPVPLRGMGSSIY